ncbi:MAG: hypothetical protein PHE78_07470 [Candidatus Gastranaerophilales bacterium]|nr:hypothetical protein [Candidatus Gastranaerophilales bacterium]
MSINFYTNQAYQQYPQVQKDVKGTKETVDKVEKVEDNVEKSFLGSLPPVRRLMSLPDKLNNGESVAAAGALALMVANFPEDCRDIAAAGGQIKDIYHGRKYTPKYNYGQYQHDFSFFKGTLFEDWYKGTKNKKVKNVLDNLYQQDESIFNTKFGEKVQKFLGITSGNSTLAPGMKNRFGFDTFLTEVKAPNAFAELTGRALKRTPKLSLIALALLEVPKLLKSLNQGETMGEQAKSFGKQTVKSGINVATVTAGIAYGGAFGAKKFGAVGSLVGMGVGAVAGAFGSKKLQDLIA